MGGHFLHVGYRLVLVKFEGNGEVLQELEALLAVDDGDLFHS